MAADSATVGTRMPSLSGGDAALGERRRDGVQGQAVLLLVEAGQQDGRGVARLGEPVAGGAQHPHDALAEQVLGLDALAGGCEALAEPDEHRHAEGVPGGDDAVGAHLPAQHLGDAVGVERHRGASQAAHGGRRLRQPHRSAKVVAELVVVVHQAERTAAARAVVRLRVGVLDRHPSGLGGRDALVGEAAHDRQPGEVLAGIPAVRAGGVAGGAETVAPRPRPQRRGGDTQTSGHRGDREGRRSARPLLRLQVLVAHTSTMTAPKPRRQSIGAIGRTRSGR
ncbi:hypothetical protein GCM10025868_33640 [Angustibacter aerolatus]|uniref:Uncharacterized protein n=1 Tax=Angustibacter aerolatus TaxID=1162965 RepID=A0ABQ6JLW9_9ACTN|nr:hypothetical protein GCM10025868_33640 [Angustibacter aerolatus]